MEKKIISLSEEREKREKARKRLVMPTKNLADYLTFKQISREVKRGKALIAKGY
jgi:hypothetical protein